MAENFLKKVAVISGGGGYLGGFIINRLAGDGFKIIIVDKNINGFGKKENEIIFIKADLSDAESAKNAFEEVKEKFGSISAVIHAASAPLIRRPLLSQSQEEFDSQFSASVKGAFNLFKYFVPLVEEDGAILGIVSKSINPGAPFAASGSYMPAKMALRGLMRVLFNELHPQKIRVYALSPAFMPGGLNKDMPDKVLEFIKKKSAPEDITSPENVSGVILDLIKDKAKSMDGKLINVPGMAEEL